MPFVVCPVCDAMFHLAVRGDPTAWEAEHVVHRTETGVPLLTCVGCWVDLQPGHKVTLRTAHDTLPLGSEGVVLSLKGDAFLVSFGGIHAELTRSDLIYVIGQPARTEFQP